MQNEQAHMQGMIRHSPCHSRPHSGCHLSMLYLARGMRTTCGVALAWARRDFFSPGYVLSSKFERRFSRSEGQILLLTVIENKQAHMQGMIRHNPCQSRPHSGCRLRTYCRDLDTHAARATAYHDAG